MTAVARTLVMWLSAQRPVGWGLLTGTRCWPLWGSPCPCGTPCAGSSPYFSQSSKWNTVLFIFLSPLPLRCSCFIQRYVLAHIISSYEGGWGGGEESKKPVSNGSWERLDRPTAFILVPVTGYRLWMWVLHRQQIKNRWNHYSIIIIEQLPVVVLLYRCLLPNCDVLCFLQPVDFLEPLWISSNYLH